MIQIAPGDVISYREMCEAESAGLRRGMNFRLRGGLSVVLMSTRADAPYADTIQDGGRTPVYQGRNAPLSVGIRPEAADQPANSPNGKLTENGKFYRAVERFKSGIEAPELVKVYEKIRAGVWVYNGVFRLVDAYQSDDGEHLVWRFRLELVEEEGDVALLIPSQNKAEVWRRDGGVCAGCGRGEGLRFETAAPRSESEPLTAGDVRLLCQTCYLGKTTKSKG